MTLYRCYGFASFLGVTMGIRNRSWVLVLGALVWAACGDETSISSTMDSGAGGGGLDGSMTARDGAAADLGIDAFVPDADVAQDAGVDAMVDAIMADASPDAATSTSCADGEGGLALIDDTFSGVTGPFVIRGTRVLVDGDGAPFIVYVVKGSDGTTHLFVARRQWSETFSSCVWTKQRVREVLPGQETGTALPLQVAYDVMSDTVAVLRTYLRDDGTYKEGFLIDPFRLNDPSLFETGDIRVPLDGVFGGPPVLAHDTNGFFVVYSLFDENDPGPADDVVEQRIASLNVFSDRLPPLDFPIDEQSLPLGFSCPSGRRSIPASTAISLADGTRVVAWRGTCAGGTSGDRIVVASNASGTWASAVVRTSSGSVYEPTLALVADDAAESVWVVSNMARETVASGDLLSPPTEVDRVPVGDLALSAPVVFPMPLDRRDRIFEAGGAVSGGTLRLFGRRAKSYFSLPDEMDEVADGPVYATTTGPGYSWSTTDIIPPSLMGGETGYAPKTAGRGANTALGADGLMWGSFFVEQYFSTADGGFWDRSVWVWREPTLSTM